MFADKVTLREQNSVALIGCSLFLSPTTTARLFFTTAEHSGEMVNTARALNSKNQSVSSILQTLHDEYRPKSERIASAQYQRQAAVGLLVKLLAMQRGLALQPAQSTAMNTVHKPTWSNATVVARERVDSELHVRGRASYTADTAPRFCLDASPILVGQARVHLGGIDVDEALGLKGVVGYVDASSIRGCNSYVGAKELERAPVFVDGRVDYAGQAVGLVLAHDRVTAERAARLVHRLLLPDDDEPIVGIDAAMARSGERSFDDSMRPKGRTTVGNVDDVLRRCSAKVRGRVRQGASLHQPTESQVSKECIAFYDSVETFDWKAGALLNFLGEVPTSVFPLSAENRELPLLSFRTGNL